MTIRQRVTMEDYDRLLTEMATETEVVIEVGGEPMRLVGAACAYHTRPPGDMTHALKLALGWMTYEITLARSTQ